MKLNIRFILPLFALLFCSMASWAEPAPASEGVDWAGAHWLKATTNPVGGGALGTVVDVDMTIVAGRPALIFGWTADRAYFQWQIIPDGVNGPVLRRCVRTFTDDPPYSDIELKGFVSQDFIGKPVHMRIEAAGADVVTYINGEMVDRYKCSRMVPMGKAGFRVGQGDEAMYDNFVLSVRHPNGKSIVIAADDFSAAESLCFMGATVVDGQCHVATQSAEYKLLMTDESYPAFYRYFTVDRQVASATLYASGLGVYDVWLNGQRVGERQSDGSMAYDQLKPGWTDYNHRVAYSAYDVTDLCRKGDNSLGAIVTPGWLASRISRGQYRHPLGLSFIAMLKIEYADGSTLVIPTDDTWATEKLSPILKSDIYDGECYDARREMPWADPSTTMPCKPELYDYPGALEPMRGPSVRALAPLQPVKTVVYELDGQGSVVERQVVNGNTPFTLRAGETALVDFGQNCSGVPQITVKGNVGTQVRMRFGEMLNDTGESSRGNDGPAGTLYTANLRSARAEARYVMRGRGDGETYSPTTTFFGYRYCEITATANVAIEQIETLPWSSSHSLNGMIETDNEDVNRLYSNILWSQISNFLSIPTDCPQRDERLGWTADAQLFASTAMYNADVAEFYAKWLGDLRDSQTADGAYTDVCPASLTEYGSAGWSDAGIVVPWQIYLMTGDHSAIAEHSESMERYMSWLASLNDETLVYPGALARYGDLFSPHPAHNRFVSQAYYYLDAVLMAKMSAVLADAGYSALRVKAQTYEALAQAIKQEIQSRWFVTSGLKAPSQSACVIALWFDLCHTDLQRKSTIEALVSLIRDNGYRLDTGFISTAYILQALCDYGYSDVAYELLTQHEYPSWMHMIDNGATTMWENWYCYMPDAGFCDVQRNSFNHYALGSFGSWMYTHMAGISATEEAAGFGKILFAPSIDTRPDCEPGRKVSRAKAVKQTAYGEVCAEWQLADDGSLTYDISVPEGSVGEVRLPFFSEDDTVYVNGQEAGLSDIVDPLPDAGGRHAFAVKPGQYHFAVGNKLSIAAVPMATGISVWPNPARDIVNIDCAEPILEVSVTSLSGKLLLKAGNAERIDVSTLPAGFYILTITTPSTTHPTKLIKR